MKIIIAFLFLCMSLNVYSQQKDSIPFCLESKVYVQQASSVPLNLNLEQRKAQYLKTHKTLKTLAWASMGAGVPLMGVGCILIGYGALGQQNASYKSGVWIFATGGLLTVGSLSLFILSSHYKYKAASVSLGAQQAYVLQQNRLGIRAQPAVTLSFRF
jgi:hypothetical protein